MAEPQRDPIEDEAARILEKNPGLREELEEFGRAYDAGEVPAEELIPHEEVRRPGSGHRPFLPSGIERVREGILANLAPATVAPDIELPEGIDLTVDDGDGTMD